MLLKRLYFLFEALFADLDACRHRRLCDRLTVGQGKIRRVVVELLRAMRRQLSLQLLRISIAAPRPLERQRGKRPCHRMIDMTGEPPIGPEGKHYLRTNLPDPQHQIAHRLIHLNPVEFAVGIIEHLAARYTQQLARCRELLPSQLGQFFATARRSPIPRRRSGSHADDVGFNSALVIKQKRTAKGTGLVIGVGSDTQKFAHKYFRCPTRKFDLSE